MKSIRALVEAKDELGIAASFYNSQRAGLGLAFLRSIDNALEEIREHPGRWPMIGKGIRRRLVSRFPYAVIYRDDPDEIVVLAIMHLHRRPGYWRDRL